MCPLCNFRMRPILVLFSCLAVVYGLKTPPVYSTDLETSLRQSLLSNYEIMQRPSKTVAVMTTLNLLSLNYLDIKEQKLSMIAYFQFVWGDPRLSWVTERNYSNIIFIFSNELTIWRPSVIVENSVDDVDVISKPQVPMRVRSDGTVVWTPGGVFTTHCEMDVTYYPLDIQSCDIQMSTWAYTFNEVSMFLDDDPINMAFYHEHGEWEILETTYSTQTTKRESQSFSRLKFTIKFRRRPLFHMLNTLFPVILMGFLTVVIFKLSPESGERVGLSLTILLAYAVYLTLISEDIPQTSLSASILSAYLASILLLQTVAVFLTVIYLDIYFKPEDIPVPNWVNSIMSCLDCRKKTNKVRPVTSSSFTTTTMTDLDLDVASVTPIGNCLREKTVFENPINVAEGQESPDKQETENIWETEDSETKYTWKEVSAMLDKCTMYLYLFLVTSVTVISMAIIGLSYVSI